MAGIEELKGPKIDWNDPYSYGYRHGFDFANEENKQLKIENEMLRAALKTYGRHLSDCYIYKGKNCDCGWSKNWDEGTK